MEQEIVLKKCLRNLLVVLVILLFILFFIFMFKYSVTWQSKADFLEYEGEITELTLYLKDQFKSDEIKADENGRKWLDFNKKQDGSIVLFGTDFNDVVPENLKDNFEALYYAFSQEDSVAWINYYDNRISYIVDNGTYALVYTYNDERPTFLSSPDENKSIAVQKIKPHWYHVAISRY